MSANSRQAVTDALATLVDGDNSAASELMRLVYDELHSLAQSYFRQQGAGHTLQPTALVHEAFLKLVDQPATHWQSRSHFFAVAARAMRQILVDHARRRNAAKRGAGNRGLKLDDVPSEEMAIDADLLALDECLTRLATIDERRARVVEARFFGGLSYEEIATVLGISVKTVERDWSFARSWLAAALEGDGSDHE